MYPNIRIYVANSLIPRIMDKDCCSLPNTSVIPLHLLRFHTAAIHVLNWNLRNLVNPLFISRHLATWDMNSTDLCMLNLLLCLARCWIVFVYMVQYCICSLPSSSVLIIYISAILFVVSCNCTHWLIELHNRSLIHWTPCLMLVVFMIPAGIAMIITRRASVRFLDMDSTQNLAVLDLCTRYSCGQCSLIILFVTALELSATTRRHITLQSEFFLWSWYTFHFVCTTLP